MIMYNADLFFEKTIEELCSEAYAKSRFGIKRGSGGFSGGNMARRGQVATTDSEQQQHFQNRFENNIQSDINEGRLYNILELIEYAFNGSRDKARNAIFKLLHTNNLKQKSWLNPFPEIEEIGPFVIPNFRLPDVISHVKTIINNTESPSDKKIAQIIFNKLGEIYQQNYNADPNEDTSLHARRSFSTRETERTFQGGEKKKVLTPATFGGQSRVDKEQGSHIHVTNSSEGEGENERRLKKYKNKSFTFDPRSNPDEHDSSSHTPERRTPENLAGPTLAGPEDRSRLATKTPKPKKKAAAKPKAKAKPKKLKESFFIKIIPF